MGKCCATSADLFLCADGWHPVALGTGTGNGDNVCPVAGDYPYTCRRDIDGTNDPVYAANTNDILNTDLNYGG